MSSLVEPKGRGLGGWWYCLPLVLSCGSPPTSPPTATSLPPNVVLVLVDTLRADHLGSYGYLRPTSPNLDQWASASVLFTQARSQASCTFPSVNSLLTSRDPLVFLGQPEGRMGIPEEISSLQEILAAAGYQTAAISASPVVRASPTRFNPHGGFARGFGTFDEACLWQSADCIEARLAALLPTLVEPYFLYLHFMEPHGPYRPPASHERRFARPLEAPRYILDGDPNPIADALYKQGQPSLATPRQLEHLIDLYDEEIAYFDSRLPAVWNLLEPRNATREVVWVLTSDHGEGFLEHGDIKHCRAPFDEQVKTPLILRAPNSGPGQRVAAAVSNLDIAPTLLELLGLPVPPSFEGRSLVPWLRSPGVASESEALSFSAQGAVRTVTDGRFKLHFDLERRSATLFELAADPRELVDLASTQPDELRRLTRLLYERLVAVEGSMNPERSLALGQEAEKRLKALGYLQ